MNAPIERWLHAGLCTDADAIVTGETSGAVVDDLIGAFLSVLTERDFDLWVESFAPLVRLCSDFAVRFPERTPELLALARTHADYRVRIEATRLLSFAAVLWPDARAACEGLLREPDGYPCYDDVRGWAALGLGRLPDASFDTWKMIVVISEDWNQMLTDAVSALLCSAVCPPDAFDRLTELSTSDGEGLQLRVACTLTRAGQIERAIETLRDLLRSDEDSVAAEALDTIREAGRLDDVRDRLVEMLRGADTRHRYRERAADALAAAGWLADETETLLAFLQSPDLNCQYFAALNLGRIGRIDDAMETLQQQLRYPHESVVSTAVGIVSEFGRTDAVIDLLEDLLRNANPYIRAVGISELLDAGRHDEALDALRPDLNSGNDSVCCDAALTLAKNGRFADVTEVLSGLFHSNDETVRKRSAREILHHDPTNAPAIETLIASLDTPHAFEIPGIVRSLKETPGADAAFGILHERLSQTNDRDVLRFILMSLSDMERFDSVRDLLGDFLRGDDEARAILTVEAVAQSGHLESFREFLPRFLACDEHIRDYATWALRQEAAPAAHPETVRAALAVAIGREVEADDLELCLKALRKEVGADEGDAPSIARLARLLAPNPDNPIADNAASLLFGWLFDAWRAVARTA